MLNVERGVAFIVFRSYNAIQAIPDDCIRNYFQVRYMNKRQIGLFIISETKLTIKKSFLMN